MFSHKVIPHCVIKHFCNNNNKCWQYNIQTKEFSETSAKKFNVEENYYSKEKEEFLCKNCERNLGVLISVLIKDFDSDRILVKKKHEETIRNYICALYSRNDMFQKEIKHTMKETFLKNKEVSEQTLNGFLVQHGLQYVLDKFADYKIIFCVSKESAEFLITSSGQFAVRFGEDDEIIIAPLTQKIAIGLYKGNCNENLLCFNKDDVQMINNFAIQGQKKQGSGYIVSASKEYLTQAITFANESEKNEK